MTDENKDAKGTNNDGKPADGADATKARIEALERENAALLKETLSKKEQIRDLESKKQTEEQDRLKEQNKFKELFEASQPKVKRLEEIETVFTQILETEIAEVQEEKRDLIPQFEKPEQKLLWLRQAKAKGLFAPKMDTTGKDGKPPATVQSKVNADKNLPEFVSWSSNDPRLTTLSTEQYRIWRAHNTKTATGVKGWGKT